MIVYRPLKAIRLKCLDCSETRKDVAECPCNGVASPLCNLHPYRFGRRPRPQSEQAVLEGPAISKTLTVLQSQTGPNSKLMKNTTPYKAIRKHCLDCAEGNVKYVMWCPCDGTHSSRCHLWPHRLGSRVATLLAKYPALVTPEAMPPATTCLDDLPDGMAAAAAYLIAQGAPAAAPRQKRQATEKGIQSLAKARAAKEAKRRKQSHGDPPQ